MSVPRPGGDLFVTDGGLETDLIFNRGFDLPEFASFPLLENDAGLRGLEEYYLGFAAVARAASARLVLSAPTWRANPMWGERLGYSAKELDQVNQSAIQFMQVLGSSLSDLDGFVLSGTIGTRGDGYLAGEIPEIDEAARYHRAQIESFATAGAEMAEALTMTNVNEAAGIVIAANEVGLPIGILFTVETDGVLPDGTPLKAAIERVDGIGDVAYFGINCAYPDHIIPALTDGPWLDRIAEIRPNASSKSHAELNESEDLDVGVVDDLVRGMDELRTRLPNLSVIGGCCGTDRSHVARIWNVA